MIHYEARRDHSSDCPVFSRADRSLRMSKNLVTDGDKKSTTNYGIFCHTDVKNGFSIPDLGLGRCLCIIAPLLRCCKDRKKIGLIQNI